MNILGIVTRGVLQQRPLGIVRLLPTEISGIVALYSSRPPKSTTSAFGDGSSSSAGGGGGSKKPKAALKITLVAPDQTVSVVNLDEAQKISKRRELKLVKIVDLDMKTQRPVYRLMTSTEYLNEDLKRREEKKRSKQEAAVKGGKVLTLSARIAEHDLSSKVQNVLKWLQKSYEVRIVISGDGDKSKQEAIATRFEQATKEVGKIVQKRIRDSDMRFQIMPVAAVAPGETPATAADPVQMQPPAPTTNKKQSQSGPADSTQHQSVRAFHSQAVA